MLTLPAPAKLNLYLHVTGKRADGFHLLDTVFQLIDLQDTVQLQARTDGQLVLHTSIAGLPDAQHLAMKAANLLKAHTACALGADIWVDKQIPSGAGLGGGSSDAATTLIGLNHLWHCNLSITQLQTLGLKLGADVPFFCSTLGTARALGIGEVLSPLPTTQKGYIVVYPDSHVPTPAVFKHPLLHWPRSRLPKTSFDDAFSAELQNDLQAPAQAIAPAIGAAIAWLSTAPALEGVRMSGSGSAVFAQFAGIEQAQVALNHLNAQLAGTPSNWRVWTLQSLTNHPILNHLLPCELT